MSEEFNHKCKRPTIYKDKICPVITNHPNFFVSILCADCPIRVEWEHDHLLKIASEFGLK